MGAVLGELKGRWWGFLWICSLLTLQAQATGQNPWTVADRQGGELAGLDRTTDGCRQTGGTDG